jgi:NitT/TauT family transport system permease protein
MSDVALRPDTLLDDRSAGIPVRTAALRPAAARVSPATVFAGLAWIALAAYVARVPDVDDFGFTREIATGSAALGVGLVTAGLMFARLGRFGRRVRTAAPWLVALAAFLALWETATAKLAWLPMPFFPPPQAIVEVFAEDYARLADSVWHSLRLLAAGYVLGALVGFTLGVAVGWSRHVGYWVHPILRFVGPLPATAWLPLAFFVFPSSGAASTFLVALATGFPVTVLTWSGIAGVNKAYYDVARTLGAREGFLVLQVAIPAALPHVFVGLFMGLGGSFAVLVVAEMLGVKAGLGWYLQWAQGWAAYANMYAALAVMALLCSGLITLLFRLRDRLLSWQKGLVQW